MPGVVRTQIGEMRSKVEMLKNVPTDSTSGGAYDHYGIIVTTRGRLRKRSGDRILTFGDIVNAEDYELTVRYQSEIAANLRTDTKFLIGGLVYQLQTWETFQEVKFYYKFILGIHKGGSVTVDAPTPISVDEGVKALWLTTTVGVSTVFSSTLVGATILGVTRSGLNHQYVAGVPGNFQFSFTGGTISFDPANPFNSGEIVYVLYKL